MWPFWLGEPVDVLVCPPLEDALLAVVSSHALPPWWTSTELNTALNKCSIYLAPFSACKLYKSFNYNQNICHPKLICWLIIACKSSSLCPGLCNFLTPLCLNRSAIPIALAASCDLKCLGLESWKIMTALHFTGGQLGQRQSRGAVWKSCCLGLSPFSLRKHRSSLQAMLPHTSYL